MLAQGLHTPVPFVTGGAVRLDHVLERSSDVPALPYLDLHAPLAVVYDDDGGKPVYVGEDAHLLLCLGKCVTFVKGDGM